MCQKIPKTAIIIASGASIRQSLWNQSIDSLPIWNALKNKFTVACNWSYKWMIPTVEMFVDYKFYASEKEKLDKLPLIVGKKDSFFVQRYKKHFEKIEDNLYFIKNADTISSKDGIVYNYWGKDCWTKGFFCSQLTGLFAISFLIGLECENIYLLGYDACDSEGYTHFYQDDSSVGVVKFENKEQTGVGKNKEGYYNTNTYNHDINYWFNFFKPELERINIKNVSLNSKINTFPKISYDQFYSEINTSNDIIQEETRQEIIKKIRLYS